MGRLSTLIVFIMTILPLAVFADMDIEQIRELVEQKKILPLEQVVEVVAAERKGRAIEVELESDHGVLVYEIEWLDEQGQVWEFEIDASSGRILEQERD